MAVLSSILTIAIGLALGVALAAAIMCMQWLARKSRRPIGLTVIALFQLSVGAIGLLLFAMAMMSFFTRYEQLHVNLRQFSLTPEELLARFGTTSAMALLAGIGLWRGTAWGWEMAIFAIACALAQNVFSLLIDHSMVARLGPSEQFYYFQHGFRICLAAAMLAYLFRPTIRRFCSLNLTGFRGIRLLMHSGAGAFLLELLLRQLKP
jgi:hypothetical protein